MGWEATADTHWNGSPGKEIYEHADSVVASMQEELTCIFHKLLSLSVLLQGESITLLVRLQDMAPPIPCFNLCCEFNIL